MVMASLFGRREARCSGLRTNWSVKVVRLKQAQQSENARIYKVLRLDSFWEQWYRPSVSRQIFHVSSG